MPRQTGLTDVRRQTLLAIVQHKKARGFPPTVQELAEAAGGVRVFAIVQRLRYLEKAGYIRREPRKARAITVLKLPEG